MDVIEQVEGQVRELLGQLLPGTTYHNLAHTERVVASVDVIAKGEGFSVRETEILHLAAWFHDVGYTKTIQGHEVVGEEIAGRILASLDYPVEGIHLVGELIRATAIHRMPGSVLEGAIRDADLSHLGASDYWVWADRLREEWALLSGRVMSGAEWLQDNLEFMIRHTWYTETARCLFDAQKQQNIQRLLQEKG